MTKLNLYNKFVEVDELFVGQAYETAVLISDHCLKELHDFRQTHRREGDQFLAKMRYCATAGFRRHHGGFIRVEDRNVIRLGLQESLFRVYGFYSGSEFIAIDALMKRKQKMSAAERSAVTRVADIRDKNQWRKKARKK